ncbi:alpha/beta fold hydrolase [Primorskyibacter aestuariivivens]|uniref:alpha/beta hydrolase n=1 Tax=Primorskyibacter aestuariivivens TaxID=1888912 RepID=UPI0023001D66|nr:alpha/beta fold hydrolase [Primorskyibacter aestuariivivens]MDA7430301.1 alpha/beta fold hydrolase [Primorskyibacter aestuariivivens]
MKHLICVLLCVAAVAGCAPRGFLQRVPEPVAVPAAEAVVQPVFVASNRMALVENGVQFGPLRSDRTHFSRLDISIPPLHESGRIEWPEGQAASPEQHFVLKSAVSYGNTKTFDNALSAAPGGRDEVILFVHGYNVNHAEAAYRLAQIAHDYEATVPVISFSWPSEGSAGGYVYDRDSVIYSRDALETLLLELTGSGRKVLLVAHSMGSQLVVETLRQMSIGGRGAVFRHLSGVALISPDIDPEVFMRQAQRIKPFPQPFVLAVSARDRVLGLSAWLAGKPRRLGAITSSDGLEGLPVQIVDLTPFTGLRAGGHDAAFTAPKAIALLRGLSR